MKFVQARNYTRAARGHVDLVVIHTAEAPEGPATAENLAAWSAGSTASQASWHYAVDADSIVQSVREEDIAWHAGPVNGYSIGVEHAGYAKQTPADWADDASIAILDRSAELVADICRRYAIPIVRITSDDLKAGRRNGICGHVDVTKGLTGGKGHTDPGPFFPWPWYLERVRAHAEQQIDTPVVAPVLSPSTAPPPEHFVPVVLAGVTWLVSPIQIAPVSIGEANEIAHRLGCELPSPDLSDAIWRAADLRIPPHVMILAHPRDGTPATLDSTEAHAARARALEVAIGVRGLSVDYKLIAGAYKDVVAHGGKLGLYGWHADDEEAAELRRLGVPTHAPTTAGPGRVVQPFFTGHALGYRDYSQGARLVRRED